MTVLSLPIVVTVNAGQEIILGTGVASVPISVNVVPAGIASGLQSVCVGSGAAARWAVVITVDGVDVTSQAVGDIRVEADEGAARIAEFTLRPLTGEVLALAAWSGKSVAIDVADASTGTSRYPMRLFTGVIETPALEQSTRLLSLRCTDDLQGRCDGMTTAQLLTLIGGYGSPAVFDAAAKGWDYAQDRLSTVPASLDISPEGAVRVTPWAPKTTPDIVLDASLVGDGSLSVSVADRSQLVNSVAVEFDYRFPRVKAECYPISYTYVTLASFAQFILDGGWWLQRAQVTAAIEAAGGTVESVAYTPLPTWIVAVGAGFFTPSAADLDLCMGFTASVSFDYAQSTEENHRIAVQNALSIAAIGPRRETMTGALEGVYPDITAAETSIRLFRNSDTSIPPTDMASAVLGKTNSVDVTLSTETNRAAANAAMKALIAVAKTRIWASHRGNRVGATVPLIPALDVDKTVRIEADGVVAQGKVSRVVHALSTETGSATSEVTLALCSVAGVGIPHDEDATDDSDSTTAGQTDLTGTVSIVFASGAAEDHTLTITFPGVEDAERNRATTEIIKTVAARLVEDEFTITI